MDNKAINNHIINLKDINELFNFFDKEKNNFNAINLSTLLNNLSRLRCNFHYYEGKISSVVKLIPNFEFEEQSIANILNALSKWKINLSANSIYKDGIAALIRQIPDRAAQFNSQEIANTLNAFSKWEINLSANSIYKDGIAALIRQIPDRAAQFNSQAIANTLNALSKWPFTFFDEKNFQLAIFSLFEQSKNSSCDNISIIALAWCLFDFQYKHKGVSSPLDEETIPFLISKHENKLINSLNPINSTQLYQVYLYKKEFISNVRIIESVMLQLSSKDEKITSSILQAEVTSCLKCLFSKIAWKEEYFINFTSVDIACPEKKLILQVNGPCHYEGGDLNPSTQFNNYLLKKEGWELVTIPYFEWNTLKTPSEKDTYIKEKLKSYSIQGNSEASSLYQTSKEVGHTIGQCEQAKMKQNRGVYDKQEGPTSSCVMQTSFRNNPLQIFHKPHEVINTRKKTKQKKIKQQNKQAIPSATIVWDDITQANLKEKIRPDELQKAYEIFEFSYQSLGEQNKIKKNLGAFKKGIQNKLKKATYHKNYELLSYRTIFSFFQGEPCRYGLRLNEKSHPKEAFTENAIKDCARLLRN